MNNTHTSQPTSLTLTCRGLTACAALALGLVLLPTLAQAQTSEARGAPDTDNLAAPLPRDASTSSAEVFAPAASVEPNASPLRLDADLAIFEEPLWVWWTQAPARLSTEDPLLHQWLVAVEGARSWLALREVFGQKTASPAIFGATRVLNITGSCLWLNMIPGNAESNAFHLGPYVDNWKSVRSSFEGHYGVQLQMSW